MSVDRGLSFRRRTAMLALSISLLGGCDMENFDITQAVGIGDANPAVESTAPTPKPTPVPTPTPAPSVPPTPPPDAVRKNMAFDFVRNQGIARTREANVPAAITAFTTAGKMKPGDKSVALWLGAIQKAQEARLAKANPNGAPVPFSNPNVFGQPGAGAAPGVPGAYGAPGSYGAPGVPQGAPPPANVPPPNLPPVDPRLVF